MKTVNTIALYLLLPLFLLTSCADWLDVKPKTSVSEADLFSREEGFVEALTGIYIQMATTRFYGRELSYGITDKLAQCYEPGGGTDRPALVFGKEDWYQFPSDLTKYYIDDVWRVAYSTLANINNLLGWLEKNGSVVTTPGYYNIIKGEALGLRAFIYTDLLRLYGPIFKNSGAASSPTLPYRTEFNRNDKKLSTAQEVTELIEKDIKAAELLLKDDPMYMQFTTSGNGLVPGRDPFLIARYKRMNLYAVKALAARMYLWKGDKTNAEKYAKEVIEATAKDGEPYFSIVSDNVTDRVFSTEIIFSMSIHEFDKRAEVDFVITNSNDYMVAKKSRIEEWFDIYNEGANDMRYREGQGFNFSGTSAVTAKYQQNAMFSPDIKNTIPLIRLPEMYYILAECTNDYSITRNYLSLIREARGSDEVKVINNEQDKLNELTKEYRKEFYAEGQLWYFYKRNALKSFLFCPLKSDMTEKHYRFPLPENEIEFGNY